MQASSIATVAALMWTILATAACGASYESSELTVAPSRATTSAMTPEVVVPNGAIGKETAIAQMSYEIVAVYPHDDRAWTQGLAVASPDRIYEGTGDFERSSLREVDLSTGQVLRSTLLPDPAMYGEGITPLGDAIIQLTWTNGIGLVYRGSDFELIGQFRYPAAGDQQPREGWGLTTDGTQLFLSDGTDLIYIADAVRTLETGELAVTGVVTVQAGDEPVRGLNELEYVDGEIYANVWQTDVVVRFSAQTGEVNGVLNLSGLLSEDEQASADVLNGIAHDPNTGHFLVTGKHWPKLFAIRLL